MIYLNEDIETLDVRTALAAVSEQRRQKVLQFRQIHDQRQSLAVYLLLCEALEKEYGIIEQPEFSYGAHGKPFLANHPDIHFNFSHCHHAVLCVVDKVPVGCDIETVPDHLDIELCHYCFNNEETNFILSSPNPTIAFTVLWTSKEALLKMSGDGLTNDLPNVLESPKSRKACFDTHFASDNSYVYTICKMNHP